MIAKALYRCLCCAVAGCCGTAMAIPPLGLTLVDPVVQSYPTGIELSLIDEVAYVSANSGVWLIDSSANKVLIPVQHSQFGNAFGVTQVVKGIDDELYIAANYIQPNTNDASALFKLDSPTNELVTWLTADYVVGVDRNLRTLGRDIGEFAADFRVDGSVIPLGVPTGCAVGVCESSQYVFDVTESGYAVGEIAIPGTIGTGPGLWAPDGSVTVLLSGGLVGGNLADRQDGNGVNIAELSDLGRYGIRLGDFQIFLTRDVNGTPFPDDFGFALVAQSDFVVLSSPTEGQFFGYYPGIVPNDAEAVVDLFDIFPELGTIDIQRISDTYAVNNRIYMVLHGNDGLYLFCARDPSVVPEPATAAMMLLGTIVALPRRSR